MSVIPCKTDLVRPSTPKLKFVLLSLSCFIIGMGKPTISKTIRFPPELFAEAEAAMSECGMSDFSEFVRRAVKSEIKLTAARHKALEDLAAEDPTPYNHRIKANAQKAG